MPQPPPEPGPEASPKASPKARAKGAPMELPTGPFEALERPPSRLLPKVGLRVAIAALLGVVLAAALSRGVIVLLGVSRSEPLGWWLSVLIAAFAGGFGAAIYIRRIFGSRLGQVAKFVDSRVRQRDFYDRLPPMGNDEVGRIASSINALLHRILRLRSSFSDQREELKSTQESLRLQEDLAQKSQELSTRLAERAMLFEVLRESAASHDLEKVLRTLVERVGPAMGCREIAVLLRERDPEGEQERFVIRAVWGFAKPEAVLGRSLALGEGIAGQAAREGKMKIVDDVREEPRYLAFWGEVPREGSYAALPIGEGESILGLLAITRAPEAPLLAVQERVLAAVADHAALAIRNAQLIAQLSELSTHDSLTGLANRRLFMQRLHDEIARAERYPQPLSVLVLDVDHFKSFNDREGHPAGDQALRGIAAALRSSVRENDLVARVGGEELAVVLPHTGHQAALEVADKLRAAVSRAPIEGADRQPLGKLSVSIGGATHLPEEPLERLLARADEALYEAKGAGRDRSRMAAEQG